MNWSQWIGAALAISSIGTLTGMGLLRGVVVNLREQLGDARNQIKAMKAADREKDKTIEILQHDLEALKRVVTGEVHWVALEDKLDEHHRESSEYWKRAENLLGEIRDELRDR